MAAMAAITLAVILHATASHAVAIPSSLALVPGAVNSNVMTDYTKEDNRKIFNNTTKKLELNLIGDLKQFLGESEQQLHAALLGNLVDLPDNINVVNESTINDLLSNIGQLTLDQVHGHAATFIAALPREAHIAMQLPLPPLKSFTSIQLASEIYKVDKIKVGVLVMKDPHEKARTDIQFKIDAILLKLCRLDTQDFDKVNPHECNPISSLASRGTELERSFYTDLITGNLACTDKTLVDLTSRKQEVHDEHPGIQNIRAAAEKLISYVTNKCQQLLNWNDWEPSKSEMEDDVIALYTELEKPSPWLNSYSSIGHASR